MNSQKPKNVMSTKKPLRRPIQSFQVSENNYINSQSIYGDQEDYLSNASFDASQHMRACHDIKDKRRHVDRQVVTSIIENDCFINSQLKEGSKGEHQNWSKSSHSKFQQFSAFNTKNEIRPHVINDGKLNGYQYARAPPTYFFNSKEDAEHNESEFNQVSHHEFRFRGEVHHLKTSHLGSGNYSEPENMSTNQMIDQYKRGSDFLSKVPACDKLKQQVFERTCKLARDTMKIVPSKYGDKEFIKMTREHPYELEKTITFDVVSPLVDVDLNDSYESYEESLNVMPSSPNPFINPLSSSSHVSVFPQSVSNPEEFEDDLSSIHSQIHSGSQQSHYVLRDVIDNPEDEALDI
jgi:hypothetical protein